PIVCCGPHVSPARAESMLRATAVDAMIVGEPEDGLLLLAALASIDEFDQVPSLTFRRGGDIVPHRAHGSFTGFLDAPYPAWDLFALSTYTLPIVNQSYVLVWTT